MNHFLPEKYFYGHTFLPSSAILQLNYEGKGPKKNYESLDICPNWVCPRSLVWTKKKFGQVLLLSTLPESLDIFRSNLGISALLEILQSCKLGHEA